MKRILAFLLLPVVATTYSCSKTDSADLKDDVPYYQNYSVAYDKTNATTSASAFFKVRDANGSRVELTNGASVTANNTTGTAGLLDKTLYNWNLSGTPDVNFVLTKNSGAKLNNSIALADISNTDFAAGFPNTVSKSSGFTFTWTGDAIGANEFMDIRVSTPDSGSSAIKVINQNNSANTITFTAADLQNVQPATQAIIEMSRVKTLPLDAKDGTSVGEMRVKLTVSRAFTLNP